MKDKKCNLNVLGERIKIQRKNLKMTQETLAERIGVARQTLAKWEINEGYPDLVMLTKLCEVFDCESGYLLGEYDFKKKEAADVGKLTGLSEDAVNALIEANDSGFSKKTLTILSYLLCVFGEGLGRRDGGGDFVGAVIYSLEYIFEKKISIMNRELNVFERIDRKHSEGENLGEKEEMLNIWESIAYLKEKGFIVQDDRIDLNNSIDSMLSDFKEVILDSLEMLEELVRDDFVISQKAFPPEQTQKRALISVYDVVKEWMDFDKADNERLMREDREKIARRKKEES